MPLLSFIDAVYITGLSGCQYSGDDTSPCKRIAEPTTVRGASSPTEFPEGSRISPLSSVSG